MPTTTALAVTGVGPVHPSHRFPTLRLDGRAADLTRAPWPPQRRGLVGRWCDRRINRALRHAATDDRSS